MVTDLYRAIAIVRDPKSDPFPAPVDHDPFLLRNDGSWHLFVGIISRINDWERFLRRDGKERAIESSL